MALPICGTTLMALPICGTTLMALPICGTTSWPYQYVVYKRSPVARKLVNLLLTAVMVMASALAVLASSPGGQARATQ